METGRPERENDWRRGGEEERRRGGEEERRRGGEEERRRGGEEKRRRGGEEERRESGRKRRESGKIIVIFKSTYNQGPTLLKNIKQYMFQLNVVQVKQL